MFKVRLLFGVLFRENKVAFLQDASIKLAEVVETEDLGRFRPQCLPDGLQVAADAQLLVYFMMMKL